MPPRQNTTALTSSFSVSDINNEQVVCPLHNQDGSNCRKRCLGEKRYRSMQEHIRRAHPEYYIPKLPATKESFELMINSPPHERPAQDPNHANHVSHHIQQHSDPSGLSPNFHLDAGLNSGFEGYHPLGQHDGGYYTAGDAEAASIYNNMQAQQRSDGYRRGSLLPVASAAAVLAQLHYHRPDSEWEGDNIGQNFFSNEPDMKNNNHDNFNVDPALEDPSFMQDQSTIHDYAGPEQSGSLPNGLVRSPEDRSSVLPSMQRNFSRGGQISRPRKSSLSQQARMAKHERKRSKDLAKRSSGDRKAFAIDSNNAATLYGRKWEDLIDAAASATEEEDSRDLTPIPGSPFQSPQANPRTSLPPFALGSQFQSYQASPLNRALTPPSAEHTGLDLQHFPSVDSSLSSNLSHQHHNSTGSGSQFQIMNPSSIDSTSSPLFTPVGGASGNLSVGPVQIYCAGCRRVCVLTESYACTACICGLCGSCTDALIQEQSRGRMSACPSCNAIDSNFKPFALDLR